jgi:chemotaxis protein methyltransferase CheR
MRGAAVVDATEDIELRLLLEAIHLKYGYDFRAYSMASLRRRLHQAKGALGCTSFSRLQERVLHEPDVLPRLMGYLTVQVSELFRDPSYFRAIREHVVPHLRTYPSIKVWVAGCGAGEEVYSFAILLREEGLEDRALIYGTDIHRESLDRAEAGVFDLARLPLFTENHRLSGGTCSLSKYYTAAYGGAVLDRSLRQRVVFSDHSLVTDTVFAEVQLVSCRNVLIYFDRTLQDRAIGLFRDALGNQGFLGLGAKESLRFSAHAVAFEDFVPTQRIYRRRGP